MIRNFVQTRAYGQYLLDKILELLDLYIGNI